MRGKGRKNGVVVEEEKEKEKEEVARAVKRERLNENGDQDPASRRVIRSEFLKLKTLINDKRDDLMSTDSDKFDTILGQFQKLHDQVNKPREQVADAEALLDLTRTLAASVSSLVNHGVTPSHFVSSLLNNYAAQSPNHPIQWNKLGLSVSPIFLMVHGSSTMLGPMENQFKQRKPPVQRKPPPRQTTTARPQQLHDVQPESKTDTDKNMSTMFDILKTVKKVHLENLILNRFSFAQTVENLFALSFLVKDGRADMTLDKDGSHYVSPKNAPASNAVMSKEVSYTHFVFRYDFQDWKIMKNIVPEGKELMPHRMQCCTVVGSQVDMGGDNSPEALAVTPIKKLSRNRGRIVQEESVVEETPECDEENNQAAAIRRCKRKLN